jgi:hypothetical protein
MNPEKVVFGFFILLAATLNFGFCLGEFDNPDHHHAYELFAAIVVNLIAANSSLAWWWSGLSNSPRQKPKFRVAASRMKKPKTTFSGFMGSSWRWRGVAARSGGL